MKLGPELPAGRILDKARRGPDPELVRRDRPGTAKAGPQRQTAPALFRDLALSLGLPRDALSASLISLAKFFSLPLDAKLLLLLRRQALSLAKTPSNSGQADSPDQPLAGPLRAAALAAAAAAGKGVTLSPEALGSYAAALAADDRDRGAPEDEAEGGAERDEPPGDRGAPGFSAPRRGGGGPFAERIEGRLPLLGVLNRIPGRDGRRWISLPFSFESGGVDVKVSLRIVLADANGIPWNAERMALDIKTGRRRWSFLLENAPGGDGQLCARAVFGAHPPLKPRAERELRKLLGSLAERLVLRDISQGAFFEEEAGAGQWDR